jgi:hypothetical protein
MGYDRHWSYFVATRLVAGLGAADEQMVFGGQETDETNITVS